MNLFISNLTADHCDLLETWFQLELNESYPIEQIEGNRHWPKWLVSVKRTSGTQMGKPGKWKIHAWISDNSFETEAEYPLIGFDPATSLEEIGRSYVACENARRIANNATAVKRMVDRCAAEHKAMIL